MEYYWTPQEVMAVLMLSLEPPHELILDASDLMAAETSKGGAWILIDILQGYMEYIESDWNAISREELARKWLLTERNSSQTLIRTQQENMQTPQETLWGGRFSTSLTTETIAFTHSIEADTRLIGYDIWGSQAHAIMLARQEIISDADLREILPLAPKSRRRFSERRFYA